MRKFSIPLYPIFVGVYPILYLYSKNWGAAPTSDIYMPLLFGASLGLVVMLLARLVTGDWGKAGLVSTVFTLAFFSFTLIREWLDWSAITLMVCEATLLVLLAVLLRFLTLNASGATKFLNFAAVVLVAMPLYAIVFSPPKSSVTALPVTLPVEHPRVDRKPDIFLIIVDGYGRADQLKRVMDFDNSAFVAGLRSRGFFVPDGGHSNYCQTQLSLASIFNLNYLQDLDSKVHFRGEDREPLNEGINNSYAAQYLHRAGYTTIGIASGFPNINFKSADATYIGAKPYSLIQTALIEMTPLSDEALPVLSGYDKRRLNLNSSFTSLEANAPTFPKPKFVMAHILMPHPPFVFTPDGQPRKKEMMFSYVDGSDYMDLGGSRESYTAGYTDQLQYLNKRLLEVVDTLLKKANSPPIIIISGDHGSKAGLDQAKLGNTDVMECFSNLQAMYPANLFSESQGENSTPVNFFRTILREVFHEPIPLLPNRSFYSAYPTPYEYIDITADLH